jgi:hypothetical protein
MCGYLYLEAREALADLMRNYDAANFTLMIRPVRILTKIFFSQRLRISYHTRRQTVGQIRKANPISSIAAKSRRHATEARRVLRVPQRPRPKMMDNSKATEYVATLCRGMAGLYRMIPSALSRQCRWRHVLLVMGHRIDGTISVRALASSLSVKTSTVDWGPQRE